MKRSYFYLCMRFLLRSNSLSPSSLVGWKETSFKRKLVQLQKDSKTKDQKLVFHLKFQNQSFQIEVIRR